MFGGQWVSAVIGWLLIMAVARAELDEQMDDDAARWEKRAFDEGRLFPLLRTGRDKSRPFVRIGRSGEGDSEWDPDSNAELDPNSLLDKRVDPRSLMDMLRLGKRGYNPVPFFFAFPQQSAGSLERVGRMPSEERSRTVRIRTGKRVVGDSSYGKSHFSTMLFGKKRFNDDFGPKRGPSKLSPMIFGR